jgi:hypothetical protein
MLRDVLDNEALKTGVKVERGTWETMGLIGARIRRAARMMKAV